MHQIVKQLYNIEIALGDLESSSAHVKTFAKNLKKQVEKRFAWCGTSNPLFAIAHLLDPSEKGCILHKNNGQWAKLDI